MCILSLKLNKMHINRLFIVLALAIWMGGGMACQQATHSEAEAEALETDIASSAADSEEATETESDSTRMRTRGLAPAMSGPFDFATMFPLLHNMVKDEVTHLALVRGYARKVMSPETISSAEELEKLLDVERTRVQERLLYFLENQDAIWLDENWQKVEAELNQLGLAMQSAEGMFTGLGLSPVLEEKVASLGSDALQWYLRFIYARDESASGEYPFQNMEPYGRMVVAGKKLQDLQPRSYYEKVEESYHYALQSLTDIHKVIDNSARQPQTTVVVGDINTDFYPFATEMESRSRFAKSAESGLEQTMGKILENMSEMSARPEHIYVIVTEWMTEEQKARRRVYQHLEAGEDVPHVLAITRPDGTKQYAVSYRFYEDAEKAEAAMQTCEKKFAGAEFLMVSVRNGEMFQLEAAME
jgi:hypothetical protein